jgi:hypothetical protein
MLCAVGLERETLRDLDQAYVTHVQLANIARFGNPPPQPSPQGQGYRM